MSYQITEVIELARQGVMRHPGVARYSPLRSLGSLQARPTFGQNEPRPSLVAIVAPVCVAKAFSHFNATVVAFGHRYSTVLNAYQFLSLPDARIIGDRLKAEA